MVVVPSGVDGTSLSLRRAWIEIESTTTVKPTRESLSLRRAWIEMRFCYYPRWRRRSLSLRRAWIEMFDWGRNSITVAVALLTESVD